MELYVAKTSPDGQLQWEDEFVNTTKAVPSLVKVGGYQVDGFNFLADPLQSAVKQFNIFNSDVKIDKDNEVRTKFYIQMPKVVHTVGNGVNGIGWVFLPDTQTMICFHLDENFQSETMTRMGFEHGLPLNLKYAILLVRNVNGQLSYVSQKDTTTANMPDFNFNASDFTNSNVDEIAQIIDSM